MRDQKVVNMWMESSGPDTSEPSSTPPRLTIASVPFLWEEAPGKPKAWAPCKLESHNMGEGERSLELPPRLLQLQLESPKTVIDGPYFGKDVLSSTLSFRTLDKGSNRYNWGARSFRKTTTTTTTTSITKEEILGRGNVLVGARDYGGRSVKVDEEFFRRPRRKGSLSISFSPKSHFLVNMYESFKQAVPWRRRQR